MTTIELHPEILTKDGEKFAVLPYREFEKLKEMLDDAQDLRELEEAMRENQSGPAIPIEELLKKYNLPTD